VALLVCTGVLVVGFLAIYCRRRYVMIPAKIANSLTREG
jgi:hypothetical protein